MQGHKKIVNLKSKASIWKIPIDALMLLRRRTGMFSSKTYLVQIMITGYFISALVQASTEP